MGTWFTVTSSDTELASSFSSNYQGAETQVCSLIWWTGKKTKTLPVQLSLFVFCLCSQQNLRITNIQLQLDLIVT